MNDVYLTTTRYCFQSITKLPLLRKLYLENSYVSIPWSLKDFNSSKFLKEVHISGGNLSSPAFYEWLNTSDSDLIDLRIVYAGLQGPLPDFLKNMISLEHLDLSSNYLRGSLPDFLRSMISLEYLRLSGNELRGPIPNFLGDMSSLEHIDLSRNDLQGEIPKSFEHLCKLRTLDLSRNKLNGSCDFFESMTGCIENYHLQELRIRHNQFMGSLPDISRLSSLEVLDISANNFSGSLKESIFWKLSNLTHLDLSLNSLEGVISEGHFSKLSKLKILNLRYNSFTLKFRDDWVPPFQLDILILGACKLSSHFPNWLRTQKNLTSLDISNSGISDTVPTWFWNISSHLTALNLSYNSISGPAPNCSFCWIYDISYNQFHGPLPQFSYDILILNLSQNKFSGSTSFLCTQKFNFLWFLDLSNNLFSNNLTDCWMSFGTLNILNLERNNFTGELPSSLKNCTILQYLGLEQNQLYGEIPAWIGASLTRLIFLGLKSNKFWGSIPSNLCHLQSIKILDISMNSISGIIPSCLNNFTVLTVEESMTRSPSIFMDIPDTGEFQIPLLDTLWVMWKGKMVEFPIRSVGLLKHIDLSSNKLSGEIPEELTSLSWLGSLNLSRNNLTGIIHENIGHLRQLDFLDLSANHLSGRIPESIADLSFLGWLNLSYNNLSGPIPTGNHLQTFDESAFIGNPQLCGLPLKVECQVDSSPVEDTTRSHSSQVNHEQWYENTGICISVILGFLVGFHGVCGPLLYSASWRTAYYQFFDKIKDGLWVFIVVSIARLKRRFQQRM